VNVPNDCMTLSYVNLKEGDFTLVPNTKRDTELAKRALLAEKQEKHLGR